MPISDIPQESGIKLSFKKTYITSNKRDVSATIDKPRLQYVTTELQIGTQKTPVSLALDTGSSDLWVIGKGAVCEITKSGQDPDFCLKYGSYDVSESTASVDQNKPFSIQYIERTGCLGELYLDNITFSGITVSSAFIAVVTDSLIIGEFAGILGIGIVENESNGYGYSNFPVQLLEQGFITRNLYSLYLDAAQDTGTIIFGAIDPTKYEGNLVNVPLLSRVQFYVNMTSISGPGLNSVTNEETVFDSGSVFSVLPNDALSEIAELYLNPVYNSTSLYYNVDCNSPTGNLTFHFGDATIDVPLSALVVYDEGPRCELLIQNTRDTTIVGDNILSWAYIVYDIDNLQLGIAQAKFS